MGRHEELDWDYEMEARTAGAASTRCFNDIARQRGKAEAERLRDRATHFRARSRRLWPSSPIGNYSINVECLLLALDVDEEDVPTWARRYRAGPGASADLSEINPRT